jgi:medium-chain acyl-[acyl-carrier-protein] hydrolase
MAPWFVGPLPSARPLVLCFPGAGGAPRTFRTWARTLGASFDLVTVQLPGRGARFAEPPWTDLQPLVQVLVATLTAELDRAPLAVAGHSWGAILAFEVARRLPCALQPALFIALGAVSPPDFPVTAPLSALPDTALVSALRLASPALAPLLEDVEVCATLLPLLRADLGMAERYAYDAREGRLSADLFVVGAQGDKDMPRSALQRWSEVTTGPVTCQVLACGHFEVVDAAVGFVQQALAQQVQRRPA